MSARSLMTLLVIVLAMTTTAHANKLDPKWTSTRAQINRLGDAAKAGDTEALRQLELKAAAADAIAMHNMGWLFENGFQGQPSDRQKACGWYQQASGLEYPPSMHSYALCLFAGSSGPGAEDEFETQAIAMMFNAAVSGWTNSSIHLAEYILNLALLAPIDADFTVGVVSFGLSSNPTHEQKVSLSYLKGMAVLYGSEDASYRGGRDALLFAAENGHPYASDSLPGLYIKWARWQIVALAGWSPPDVTGMDCYRANQASSKDMRDVALECGRRDREPMDDLEKLMDTSMDLRAHVQGQVRVELVAAIDDLNTRSKQFRDEAAELNETFLQHLME